MSRNALSSLFVIVALFCFAPGVKAQQMFTGLDSLIENGYFSSAEEIISEALALPEITPVDAWKLGFRRERMDRIKKDFNKTGQEVVQYIRKYIPGVNTEMMTGWEKEGSLEVKIIDGQKRYFSQAARNLFRINKTAKSAKIKAEGSGPDYFGIFLRSEIAAIKKQMESKTTGRFRPVPITYTYTLTLKGNSVPGGEMVSCWLPFPASAHLRQADVRLISTNDSNTVISPAHYQHHSLYMQKQSGKDEPLKFEYSSAYSAYAEVHNVNFENISSINVNTPGVKEFTEEEYPYIVFNRQIKELSEKIIGNETRKGRIIKLIYAWISDNIPWASAREYSTIPNISSYCAENGHGDCGIQTLLFMTLCRYNGIPARWQSGWMLHPGAVNLHDWCRIYLDDYGWVPVDQSFGLQKSDDEFTKWFFLGNTDSYHLIVNDGISHPFFPGKIHPRSETVDFQRGEVEWRGGNLYFDKWDYHMEVGYGAR